MERTDIVIPRGMEPLYQRLHFAPAVKDPNRLFCAGVIGTGPDGKAPADAELQFTCAFEALKSILVAGGSSLDKVMDMTTFHVGLYSNIETFMKVKDRYLKEPYPARTPIGISELAIPGALVEIKVVARV
jgi:enamine deaminase RidA (YjgF/YER057c/UK114 family)